MLWEQRLENDCHARLDVISLMRGQTPAHSAIVDFVGKHSVCVEEKTRSWQAHLDEKITALEGERVENEECVASLFGETSPWTPPRGRDGRRVLVRLKGNRRG